MNTGRDDFMRFLTTKHGTGIANSADDAGNHRLGQSVADDYATNGRAIPPEMAAQIRELNDITQSESMLAKASPASRAALSGTGYDPLAVRDRAAFLENAVMNGSAEARNAMAAAELRQSQAQAVALEQNNRTVAATFDSTVDLTNSANRAGIVQNEAAVNALEDGMRVRELESYVLGTGADLQDLYEVYNANDPATMQAAFGTTDVREAHMLLQHMQVQSSDLVASRVQGMTDAVTVQLMGLANDDTITNQQLQAWANGSAQKPADVSDMAIAGALEQRTTLENNRTALQLAESEGIVAGLEHQALVVGSMSETNIAEAIAMAVGEGATATAVTDVLRSGRIDDVADAVLAATDGGSIPLQIPSINGTMTEIPAQTLLDELISRHQNAEIANRQKIVSNHAMEGYAREMEQNARMINAVDGMLGVPVPGDIRMLMESGFNVARSFYEQAATATTSEERTELVAAGMAAMESSRELLVESARDRGVPEGRIEDVRQGRFTSDETFNSAFASALQGEGGGILPGILHDYAVTLGVDREQIQDWATNGGSAADITELGDGWFASGRLQPEAIVGMVESVGLEALSAGVSSAALNSEAFAKLPQPAQDVIAEALQPGAMQTNVGDANAETQLNRLISAVRVADEMAYGVDQQAVLAGAAPTYNRGEFMAVISESLRDPAIFTNALAPGGRVDRGTAAILTMYVGSKVGGVTSGPNATATADLPLVAAQQIINMMNVKMTGTSMSNIDVQMSRVNYDARRAGRNTVPEGQSLRPERRVLLEQAAQMVYMERLFDKERTVSGAAGALGILQGAVTGTGIQAADDGNSIASQDAIIEMLETMGQSELARAIEDGTELEQN